MTVTSPLMTIYCNATAMQKFWYWVDMAPGEVGALGLLGEYRGSPLIEDFFLAKQEVTQAHVEYDQDDIARIMLELAQRDPPREADLRARVHSHGGMSTFWSREDDDDIDRSGASPLMVSVLVNKKREMRVRVDIFDPIRVTIDDIGPLIIVQPNPEMLTSCKEEFDKLVTKAKYFSVGSPLMTRPNAGYYRGFGGGRFDNDRGLGTGSGEIGHHLSGDYIFDDDDDDVNDVYRWNNGFGNGVVGDLIGSHTEESPTTLDNGSIIHFDDRGVYTPVCVGKSVYRVRTEGDLEALYAKGAITQAEYNLGAEMLVTAFDAIESGEFCHLAYERGERHLTMRPDDDIDGVECSPKDCVDCLMDCEARMADQREVVLGRGAHVE